MSIQNRVAAALDATHSAPAVFDNIQVEKIRLSLAAWLDGKMVRRNGIAMGPRLVRAYCDCLEMVARRATAS